MPRSTIASLASVDFGAPALGAYASGTVLMETAAPADGDLVTLTDCWGKTLVFEFGTTTAGTDVGGLTNDTIANARDALVDAVNASVLLIRAAAGDTGEADLFATEPIAQGNSTANGGNADIVAAFATGANVTVTNFSGGAGGTREVSRLPQNTTESFYLTTAPHGRKEWANAAPVEMLVREGGKHTVRIENATGSNDLSVSLEVSENGEKFVPLTAANNLTTFAGQTVVQNAYVETQIALREGVDARVRLVATGGARGTLQVRHDHGLDPVLLG